MLLLISPRTRCSSSIELMLRGGHDTPDAVRDTSTASPLRRHYGLGTTAARIACRWAGISRNPARAVASRVVCRGSSSRVVGVSAACHAGGRRFESGRSRSRLSRNARALPTWRRGLVAH